MRYSLAIYNDDETYQDIEGYSIYPEFSHLNEKKINDIIEFTCNFENEKELKYFLRNGINDNFIDGHFAINFYKNKTAKAKRLPDNIAYKKDLDKVDFTYIRIFFRNNINNTIFINYFINRYYNYLSTVPIFNSILSDIRYYNGREHDHEDFDFNIYERIDTFLNLYCYSKNKDNKYVPNSKRIIELGLFILSFQKRHINEEEELEEFIQSLKEEIDHYTLALNDANNDEERNSIQAYIDKLESQLEIYTYNSQRRL